MKKKLYIEGMSCQHCVGHVRTALSELDEVKSVEVSLDDKYAVVEVENTIDDEKLKYAVEEEAGYTLTKVETV